MTTVGSIVFWVAAVIAVLSGLGVVTARNAIYSALSLIVTLAQFAVLYLLLNAQFIAAVQILIYAGAIMVLFLFVITLLGVQEYPFIGERLPLQRTFSVILGSLLLLAMVFLVSESPNALTGVHGSFNAQLARGNVEAFGTQLFTTFVFPFELTPLLLLVAMIGAVALSRGRRRDLPAGSGSSGEAPVASRPVAPAGSERTLEEVDV